MSIDSKNCFAAELKLNKKNLNFNAARNKISYLNASVIMVSHRGHILIRHNIQ